MLVEAEIKARVRDPERLHAALSERAEGERSVYHDRYFDLPDRRLTGNGRELRVRVVTPEEGSPRVLLTYKEPALDVETGSQPEHETTAADAEVLVTALTALGGQVVITAQDYTTELYTDAVAARR